MQPENRYIYIYIRFWFFSSALKVTGTNDYIFDNNPRPESGEFQKNGIYIKYFYELSSEDIVIDGPTPIGFTAEVYRANRQQRPTITYTYYTSNGNQPVTQPPPNVWQTSNGQCSVTCGNGMYLESQPNIIHGDTTRSLKINLSDSNFIAYEKGH